VNQPPLVSVIVPVYNNAQYLDDAINSVLNQTYRNLELIIVNDSSPDNAFDVIHGYDDPRIRYIEHEKNMGLSAARNTGIRSSTGDYIALLDGDDYFHLDKLKAHVEFFQEHTDVDVTYNARFELNHSSTTIRELWSPPATVDLGNFILGYPFSPSDMVLKRDCLFEVDLFEVGYTYYGEDMDINCKLALAGCKFASVGRALNYRRFHSRRIIKNLHLYKEDEFGPLYKTFSDSRFPDSLLSLKDISLSNRYFGWAIFAFLQEDTVLGQEYFSEAVRLNPALLNGRPPAVSHELIKFCILDDGRDHEELLQNVLQQLPDEFQWIAEQGLDWLISRGYLLKGIRSIMWGRLDEGREHFAHAIALNAKMSKPLLSQISADLVGYEKEFGVIATLKVIQDLTPYIDKIENPTTTRWSMGLHLVNRAYMSFNLGEFARVRSWVTQAIIVEPTYLMDRGVIKIFILSFLKQLGGILFQKASMVD